MNKKTACKIIEYILVDGNFRALYDFEIDGVSREELIKTGTEMKKMGLLNDFKVYPDKNGFGTGLVTDAGKDYWQAVTDDSVMGQLYYYFRFTPAFHILICFLCGAFIGYHFYDMLLEVFGK